MPNCVWVANSSSPSSKLPVQSNFCPPYHKPQAFFPNLSHSIHHLAACSYDNEGWKVGRVSLSDNFLNQRWFCSKFVSVFMQHMVFSVFSVVIGFTEIKKAPEEKNTKSNHDSNPGDRKLNETQRSVIARYRNFNAPKICKITVHVCEKWVQSYDRRPGSYEKSSSKIVRLVAVAQ